MVDDASRRVEHEKYERAYLNPHYRMKDTRKADAVDAISALPVRGSYLDVSCGRGEMLDEARGIGFDPVMGTEKVARLIDGRRVVFAEGHALPFGDKSFDVVTSFDVIEHVHPGDDEALCREMARVARQHVVLSANNQPSFNKAGDDLHINKRRYAVWDRLFREWFRPGRVTWLGSQHHVSELWRIDL